MASSKVTFAGSQGATLAARLDLPAGAPRAYALFAHCFTCSKDSKAPTFIAGALAEAGFALLRFDFTGLGGSEGEFENTGFSSNVADLEAAAGWLRMHHRPPAILIGALARGRRGSRRRRSNRRGARDRHLERTVCARPCDAPVRRQRAPDRT